MIASGSLDPEPLVSREIELAALPGQLEEMAATPVDVKVLVELAAGATRRCRSRCRTSACR